MTTIVTDTSTETKQKTIRYRRKSYEEIMLIANPVILIEKKKKKKKFKKNILTSLIKLTRTKPQRLKPLSNSYEIAIVNETTVPVKGDLVVGIPVPLSLVADTPVDSDEFILGYFLKNEDNKNYMVSINSPNINTKEQILVSNVMKVVMCDYLHDIPLDVRYSAIYNE